LTSFRILGFALALLLCAPSSFAQEGPVEIDAILPLTGQGAFIGKAEQQSLGVLETTINAGGGIKGRPLKFIVVDDTSNPQVALQLASQIIAKHVTVMIGPGLTASCSAVLPLLANGPFDYCLAPGIHPPAGSFMFSANASTVDDIRTEIRYARLRGWTRLGYIATTDASGQDIGNQVDEALTLPENKGVQLVARQVFAPTDLSVTAQMQVIKSANPQVLIAGMSGTPFGTVLRGAHDVGIEVPVIALSSNMHLEQMAQYTSFLPHELLFGSSRGAVFEPRADPRVKQAQAAFFEAFKRAGIVVANGHSVPWDAVQIVVDALRHLGPNATAAQLRDYVNGVRFTGIDGSYDFHSVPQRGLGDTGTIIYTWNPAQKDFTIASKPRGEI
jgi:branched-chain amino acid transport system substrate-binding protein